MKRFIAPAMIVLCLTAWLGAVEPTTARAGRLWLVVTRKMFTADLKPLVERRRREGFDVAVSTLAPDKAIASMKRRPSFILLVGDDQPASRTENWYLPAPRRKLYRWRSVQPKQFAADMLLGDFDNDLVPDAPVGRLPVRTTKQLKGLVAQIVAYESRQLSPDDLRLPAWGGSPGYNALVDAMTTSMALTTVKTNSPRWSRPWMILADPKHPLCGTPEKHAAMFTKQLSRGGAIGVMMGHSSPTGFHSMKSGGKDIWFTAREARKGLTGGPPAPAVTIFSCDTGNFAGKRESLAESMLLTPGGPVAVIAATTESHPLTNYFTGLCLLQSLGRGHKRLGDLWLDAQRKAKLARNPLLERLLRDVEGKLEDKINVDKLRRDQMLMYALLGDPATRVHLPDRLRGKIKYVDGKWKWQARRPEGTTVLHVGFRADGQSIPMPRTPEDRADRDKLFARADETFAFKPLGRLGPGDTWAGTLAGEGTLRLVAVGPGKIYAAAINLRRPTTRPAPARAAKQ
ncbi:MAG: C25 family cysteine peptidase [Phycisphaerae bacterium]|jgi:hypothetical protein|nr:C25 family cysteine peptidase [Phycisphaerae bacterium]